MCLDTHETKNNTKTKRRNPCQSRSFFYIKEVESTGYKCVQCARYASVISCAYVLGTIYCAMRNLQVYNFIPHICHFRRNCLVSLLTEGKWFGQR